MVLGAFQGLEALAVDDLGTNLVVLLFGDPHLLEGVEGGQDGAAHPDGVLALRWVDHLQERETLICLPLVADCGICTILYQ